MRAPDDDAAPLPDRKKAAPPPDPYFVLPLPGDTSEGGLSCVLRPSVMRVLYRAWCDTQAAASMWLNHRAEGRVRRIDGEETLATWVHADSAAAFREDLWLCLASGEACRAPHMYV